MSLFYDHEAFLKELLPRIERNVRESDQLEPVMILRLSDGRESIAPMGEFFCPGLKDAIVPVVELVFENYLVEMIAVISECWVAEMKTEAEVEAFEDSSLNVSDLDNSVEGVMVSIFSRDRRDKMFSLRIKPDRTGVEQQLAFNNSQASGRFVRPNPNDN